MFLLSLGLAGDARACGGFFCNNVDPVDQIGETIVFEVEDGTVTTHARITYAGAARDFAWVLPVPGIPEVFLSAEALFDQLKLATEPVPRLVRTYEPECAVTTDTTSDSFDTYFGTFYTSGDPPPEDVRVLAAPKVGPYEGVVLSATDEVALVGWLQDNGYGVPDTFAAAAAPYLADGMNFLALGLTKDADIGSLPPLGVKWPGTRPSVPLTLTAVAAQPGMPLTVYVLGDARAVPLSYLHVQLNPLVYDWFGTGRSWLEMVGLAADEAGGRGFATTYAGGLANVDLACDAMNTSGLAEMPVALDWFLALRSHGFPGTADVLAVLRDYVPAPPGVPELYFYNQWSDYDDQWAAMDARFDPVAATQALEDRVVTPCLDADAVLARNSYVTRLTSTISPEEMQVDPVFGFNPDLPDVSNLLQAEFHDNCDGTGLLTLPGGFELQAALTARGGTEPSVEWVEERLLYHALVIEQLTEENPPLVIADHTDWLVAAGEDPGTATTGGTSETTDTTAPPAGEATGCGCASGAPSGTMWLAVAALLARRRR